MNYYQIFDDQNNRMCLVKTNDTLENATQITQQEYEDRLAEARRLASLVEYPEEE